MINELKEVRDAFSSCPDVNDGRVEPEQMLQSVHDWYWEQAHTALATLDTIIKRLETEQEEEKSDATTS